MPDPLAERARLRHLPTAKDLDELSQALRSTAKERGLSDETIDRYEEWVFLYLSWCLTVPPFGICRNRIGAFWSALQERKVNRWQVCQAMDALGFFFGALLGRETFSFPRRAPTTPPSGLSAATVEGLYSPLPLGSLSQGACPSTVVPTRPDPPDAPSSDDAPPMLDAASPPSEERPTFWDFLDQHTAAPSPSARTTPLTITLPPALADRVEAYAQQNGLSPEAFVRQVLGAACRDETPPRGPCGTEPSSALREAGSVP